jgi:hypothetical protein
MEFSTKLIRSNLPFMGTPGDALDMIIEAVREDIVFHRLLA